MNGERNETAVRIAPGEVLHNGATVIATSSEPDVGGWLVVLALRGSEYITWKVDPETGDAFWGDYFRDFGEAARNYEKRVNG